MKPYITLNLLQLSDTLLTKSIKYIFFFKKHTLPYTMFIIEIPNK